MSPFDGFSKKIFECCHPSEKIRVPINSLKELKLVIEPKLKRFNSDLSGHVSRTKAQGTNDYYSWAWLYFSTIGTGAYRYSQLTANISPSRIYAGVCLLRKSECYRFESEIKKETSHCFNKYFVPLAVENGFSQQGTGGGRNKSQDDILYKNYEACY